MSASGALLPELDCSATVETQVNFHSPSCPGDIRSFGGEHNARPNQLRAIERLPPSNGSVLAARTRVAREMAADESGTTACSPPEGVVESGDRINSGSISDSLHWAAVPETSAKDHPEPETG